MTTEERKPNQCPICLAIVSHEATITDEAAPLVQVVSYPGKVLNNHETERGMIAAAKFWGSDENRIILHTNGQFTHFEDLSLVGLIRGKLAVYPNREIQAAAALDNHEEPKEATSRVGFCPICGRGVSQEKEFSGGDVGEGGDPDFWGDEREVICEEGAVVHFQALAHAGLSSHRLAYFVERATVLRGGRVA